MSNLVRFPIGSSTRGNCRLSETRITHALIDFASWIRSALFIALVTEKVFKEQKFCSVVSYHFADSEFGCRARVPQNHKSLWANSCVLSPEHAESPPRRLRANTNVWKWWSEEMRREKPLSLLMREVLQAAFEKDSLSRTAWRKMHSIGGVAALPSKYRIEKTGWKMVFGQLIIFIIIIPLWVRASTRNVKRK